MKKRVPFLVLSLLICSLFIVSATYAYFTAKTGPVTNTFTASDGITISLAEPTWDNSTHPDGASDIPADELGKTLATNFLPGRHIPKNPSIKNTSSMPIWVGIKLDYTGTANSFTHIDAFADIDFNTNQWERKDDTYTVFYYRYVLDPNETTEDLFTRVLIDSTAAAEHLKDFEIHITAYAVQGEGIDTYDQAKTELENYMDTVTP